MGKLKPKNENQSQALPSQSLVEQHVIFKTVSGCLSFNTVLLIHGPMVSFITGFICFS